MRFQALVIASAVFLMGSVGSKADEDPSGLWMIGYMQIQDAVKAETENNSSFAIGKFQQALWSFYDIARRFPAFELRRRTERINLLSDKIKSLGGIPIAIEPLVRSRSIVMAKTQSDRVELPPLPEAWGVRKEGGVVLPAVITPETRDYSAEVKKWWAQNGRIQTEFAVSE